MKRKPMKSGTVALILVLIYVIGLLVGFGVVCYLLSASKRPGLAYVTDMMAADYAATGQMDPSPISGRVGIVYNADGEAVDLFQASGRPIYFDFTQQGTKYLPKVLKGNETLHLVLFAKDDTTLGYTSLVYFGIPLMDGETVTGALLWVRELQDLLETLLAFFCTFTVVFAIVTVFILLNLRNQRRYEQMRRHYIDNITHELKTPVASIKALAEALSDGMEKSPTDRNVYYGMILREANRQERMICDVLELSKLQSVQIKLTKQPVDSETLFAPVLEKYASYCDLMGISLLIDDSISSMPELYTDEKHIQVVLDALLSNAVKFVPEDGTITVSAQLSRKQATICIADNGKGISRQELPRVFERFYKVSRNDNESGSGLGLAIAREITDNLHEKLWIESEEGTGTRAYFTISMKK